MMFVCMFSMILMAMQTEASTSLGAGANVSVCGGEIGKDGKVVVKAGETLKGCQVASGLSNKIENVVKTFTGLVGAFAVGMIVYGGFKYIMSQGDPKAAEGAKNVIWYSGVGLFIVLVAYIVFDLLVAAMK